MITHLLFNGDVYEITFEDDTGNLTSCLLYPDNKQQRGQPLALNELSPQLLHKIHDHICTLQGDHNDE